MAINVKMIQHIDYLEFVVTGSHDMTKAIDRFSHLLDACKQTGLTKVLVDYRKLNSLAGGTEKILYAFGVEDLYIKYLNSGGQKLQIAYLAPSIHTYSPGADIGRKIESLQFELFDKSNEALEWLCVESTEPSAAPDAQK